jgi:hypothetical protein
VPVTREERYRSGRGENPRLGAGDPRIRPNSVRAGVHGRRSHRRRDRAQAGNDRARPLPGHRGVDDLAKRHRRRAERVARATAVHQQALQPPRSTEAGSDHSQTNRTTRLRHRHTLARDPSIAAEQAHSRRVRTRDNDGAPDRARATRNGGDPTKLGERVSFGFRDGQQRRAPTAASKNDVLQGDERIWRRDGETPPRTPRVYDVQSTATGGCLCFATRTRQGRRRTPVLPA